MPHVSGFLRVTSRGNVDNDLPEMGHPTDPNFGVGQGGNIDNELPSPPPVWPPLTIAHPIQPAPGVPPGTIWPPIGHPSHGLPNAPARPDQGLPNAPGRPSQGLPSNTFWVVAGIPGVGWRYICVDPSLVVGMPLPETPPAPGQALPPTPGQALPPTPPAPGQQVRR